MQRKVPRETRERKVRAGAALRVLEHARRQTREIHERSLKGDAFRLSFAGVSESIISLVRLDDTISECPSENGIGNDPSAGSPTETLLRLLLSPSDRV